LNKEFKAALYRAFQLLIIVSITVYVSYDYFLRTHPACAEEGPSVYEDPLDVVLSWVNESFDNYECYIENNVSMCFLYLGNNSTNKTFNSGNDALESIGNFTNT